VNGFGTKSMAPAYSERTAFSTVVTRRDDHRSFRGDMLHAGKHFKPVHLRHHDVAEDNPETPLFDGAHRIGAAPGGFYRQPLGRADMTDGFEDDLFVVDDQDVRGCGHRPTWAAGRADEW
jgi:hypothetical protein